MNNDPQDTFGKEDRRNLESPRLHLADNVFTLQT